MELLANPQKLAAYREQAAALTAQMTLEEKVSQTLYNAPAIPRLGIPAYNWWNEALHGIARAGTATVFPQAIAMAAAFDEEARRFPPRRAPSIMPSARRVTAISTKG